MVANSPHIDEAETFITHESNELRGILNSGHTRQTAFVMRCVGDDHEPTQFSTWCPKVFALIGRLPPTLEDRSIILPMRRKLPHETVLAFEAKSRKAELLVVRRKCVRWANDNRDAVRAASNERLEGLHDRAADNWRPLLGIANVLGEKWPEKTRAAALALAALQPQDGADFEIMILEDLKALFTAHGDRLASSFICNQLDDMEERPWPEWKRRQTDYSDPACGTRAALRCASKDNSL